MTIHNMRADAAKALAVLAWILSCGSASAADTVKLPWDMGPLSVAPKSSPAAGFEEKGVSALFFDGVPYKGAPTRVFAWYGAPKVEPGQKVPAMVLVHGGGGTAFATWVRLWTGRGYAAIAMDTCGCVPRGVYGKWDRDSQGGPGGWGGFSEIDGPMTEQWTWSNSCDANLKYPAAKSGWVRTCRRERLR